MTHQSWTSPGYLLLEGRVTKPGKQRTKLNTSCFTAYVQTWQALRPDLFCPPSFPQSPHDKTSLSVREGPPFFSGRMGKCLGALQQGLLSLAENKVDISITMWLSLVPCICPLFVRSLKDRKGGPYNPNCQCCTMNVILFFPLPGNNRVGHVHFL